MADTKPAHDQHAWVSAEQYGPPTPGVTDYEREEAGAEKGKALAASQPTDTLLDSLAGLGHVINMARTVNDHEYVRVLTLMHAWIVEALEVRYPAAAQIMADRFDAADPSEDIDYATELRLAVEKVR